MIRVNCTDENIQSSTIKMNPDDTVSDQFEHFKKKIKHLNKKNYYFKEIRPKVFCCFSKDKFRQMNQTCRRMKTCLRNI